MHISCTNFKNWQSCLESASTNSKTIYQIFNKNFIFTVSVVFSFVNFLWFCAIDYKIATASFQVHDKILTSQVTTYTVFRQVHFCSTGRLLWSHSRFVKYNSRTNAFKSLSNNQITKKKLTCFNTATDMRICTGCDKKVVP